MKELTIQITSKPIPAWCRWVAQDRSGEWHAFFSSPVLDLGTHKWRKRRPGNPNEPSAVYIGTGKKNEFYMDTRMPVKP